MDVHSSFLSVLLLTCWSGRLAYSMTLNSSNNIKRNSCITVGGPAEGSACVFPFNYNGVSHSYCTTVDDTKPWCSTKTDANNDHVSGVDTWGYCGDNCSGSRSTKVCSVTSGPGVGSPCVFPFNFMGVTHSNCTTVDDTKAWCSTQTDANNDHVSGVGAWGYCDDNCSGSGPTKVCSATSGPGAGSPCVAGCSTIDGDSVAWCFTETSWGYCDATCPVQGTVAPTTTEAPHQESCQCGVKGNSHTRIVGGHEAEKHEYPWQVGLVWRNRRRPMCGGTLISSNHVLTAAHCTVRRGTELQLPASTFQVLLGEHNIRDREFNRVDIAEIINHPDYKSFPRSHEENDYAILRLANPVPFTKKVSPACLPADLSATYAGVRATTTGWGALIQGGPSPNVLQEVDVTVITNAKCKSAYGGRISSNMLCAKDTGKDSCQGDSGGPIIAPENGRQALIGVVSWGWGCANPRYPGVYARVTEQMDWILANTAGTFSSTCKALN